MVTDGTQLVSGDRVWPTVKTAVALSQSQGSHSPRGILIGLHSMPPPLAWGCPSALCIFSWHTRLLTFHIRPYEVRRRNKIFVFQCL